MTEVSRLFDLLAHFKQSYKPKDDVLAMKDGSRWVKYSLDQYIHDANAVSYALLHLGVKPGDRVATVSGGRPEWNIVDMGIMQMGAIHVPVYPTISESDYLYILNHCEAKVVFVSGRETYRKLQPILAHVEAQPAVYAFKDTEGVAHLKELIAMGDEHINPGKLAEIQQTIQPLDLATIIYTSGTTGNPKGVMLNHHNIISNFIAVEDIPPVGEEGRALSYLPLCHIYERMMVYLYQYLGISVYYAESPATVGDNLKEVQPDIFTTVPRLLEKVYDKIIATGRKQKGIKKSIFFWAVNVGLHYDIGKESHLIYGLRLKIARKLVFSKWQQALGGKLKVVVSGGAALQPRLAKVFWAAGIPVLEGYGLTETSPVIAVNNFEKDGVGFGTVGPKIKGVEVKIADDGEILTKGPCVMMGYYKEPQLTSEAIDGQGWFHTGDLGVIEPKGHLKITGRKKEIFKTSFGKYISPALIENRLKESAFIDNVMVVGENQKFAAALVVPDFAYLRGWCSIKGVPYTTDAEMVDNERVQKRVYQEIHHCNKHLGSTEQIKAFAIVGNEWTVDSGELTASLKLKRPVINQKYAGLIEGLFNKSGD